MELTLDEVFLDRLIEPTRKELRNEQELVDRFLYLLEDASA